ncbi:MAG TPA: hypothetical protein VF522_21925 [Ramlibacter sp.]|uniref:hypothetical protein n=1 Tax=Ramlibacter sp. TaxID=1917967 RepID=UPI002ED4C013
MHTATRAGALAALVLSCLSYAPLAFAGPSNYVHTPIVEEGEREVDFKAGTAKLRDGSRVSEYSLGLGWGVNSRWFTEFYGKWHKEPGERHGFDAWEWENKFQLTETGRYPVDVGFLLEIERPKDRSEGYEYKWGPLLQMDLGTKVQANLNVLIEKHIRAVEAEKAELGYEWQLKYRYRPEFEFGAQGFGDVGPWNHWEPRSEQPHTAGPALFGKFHVGNKQVIKYNAAVLFGLTHGSPRNAFRLQTEYEF